MKYYLMSAVIVLSLVACASAPAPIQYYRINPAGSEATEYADREGARNVVLDVVELPGFLSQPGLVMQSGHNRITISKTHLWAERLDKALPRLLVTKLQRRSEEFVFYQADSDWVAGADYRLRIRVDNLQATSSGEVITSGSFQLMDARSSQPSMVREFRFSRDLQGDGYAGAVTQLDYLLGKIADSILHILEELSPENPA